VPLRRIVDYHGFPGKDFYRSRFCGKLQPELLRFTVDLRTRLRPFGAKPNENGKPVPALAMAARLKGSEPGIGRQYLQEKIGNKGRAIDEKPTFPGAGGTYNRYWFYRHRS